MAIDGTIKPNESFWINLSAESIYGSSEKISKATETLKTVITWAFAIFSVGGLGLSAFGNSFKDYDSCTLFCLGVGFSLLTICYFLSSYAQFPVAKKYKDTHPVEIKQVFSNRVKTQSFFFKLATGLTFLGLFCIALAILLQFNHMKENAIESNKKASSSLIVIMTGVERKNDTTDIPVTITNVKTKKIILSFIK